MKRSLVVAFALCAFTTSAFAATPVKKKVAAKPHAAVVAKKKSKARAPAAKVAAATEVSPSANGYKPQTKYDNSPYRFNMTQNGKKMSPEEFDAWMKARGIRVATGKPAAAETKKD